MIQTEFYMTRPDGVVLIRARSDQNCKIEMNGELFDEAIYPSDSGYEYTETEIPVDSLPEPEVDPEQIPDADALRIITGGV